MWSYRQSTGELISPKGIVVATGYSGAPDAKNNPAMESFHNVGPIPRGRYTISAPVDTVTHGPYVLPLQPDVGNEMYGRLGFLIHGDSKVEPGSASEGCMIMPEAARKQIWLSNDHLVEVV